MTPEWWTTNKRVSTVFCPTRFSLKSSRNRGQDALLTQEDHRARFCEHYHKGAEEYDWEFAKKYDEDLDTTLIFVSFVYSPLVRAC